jgi:hypothetical protein
LLDGERLLQREEASANGILPGLCEVVGEVLQPETNAGQGLQHPIMKIAGHAEALIHDRHLMHPLRKIELIEPGADLGSHHLRQGDDLVS